MSCYFFLPLLQSDLDLLVHQFPLCDTHLDSEQDVGDIGRRELFLATRIRSSDGGADRYVPARNLRSRYQRRRRIVVRVLRLLRIFRQRSSVHQSERMPRRKRIRHTGYSIRSVPRTFRSGTPRRFVLGPVRRCLLHFESAVDCGVK